MAREKGAGAEWGAGTRRGAHPAARRAAEDFGQGLIGRREFLARATATGLALPAAAALGGLALPAPARATPRAGGTLRFQIELRALKDPRAWDWSQIANVCRGWLEYLVEYTREGGFRGMLLEGWEVNDDATEYLFRLRPGVTWNDGRPFTADDVAWNFARWADSEAPGNSMAGRIGPLLDPLTGQLSEGAVEIIDDLTLALHLPAPDVTLIANLADYPAAIVHPDYRGGDPWDTPLGTGPYRPEGEYAPGASAVLVRATDHAWWGSEVFGGPWLDRIEFVDLGTDPATHLAALESGEVDVVDESAGRFASELDSLGFERSDVMTAATYVVRANAGAEVDGRLPYADTRIRRALALAVDNGICLELGYAGNGDVAANHHCCPIHPDYADIGPSVYDPVRAAEIAAEAGMADFVHRLISIDDEWQRNTCDAVAAMMRDAGLEVERVRLPGADFWSGWQTHPFSGTEWIMRPLAIQVLSLAYVSDSAWNETGYANPDFDAGVAEALSIADATRRQAVMARLERMLVEDGVIIQPFWRRLIRHYRKGIVGAEMHPTRELRLYELAWAAA